MATTEGTPLVFDQEFDLDRSLYPSGLDWTFNKPEGVAYVCVYIIKKEEEEEEEEVCGKWTEDKDELTDQDTGELCWCCENCGAYPNWGVDCE